MTTLESLKTEAVREFERDIARILMQEFFWTPEQNDAHIRIANLLTTWLTKAYEAGYTKRATEAQEDWLKFNKKLNDL